MSEGLTRRRGAGAAPSAAPSSAGDSAPPSRPKSQQMSGSSVEGGRGKIAYDPRDLNDESETKGAPRLTLMEEVLLLGLKDKAVRHGWLPR